MANTYPVSGIDEKWILRYLKWVQGNCNDNNYMGTKEQIQDAIEVLTHLDIGNLDEESREEATYIVNDIIISLEELIDLL
tara:strand:+ start:615 stop:854 length:240 start_codon:yes stop_codon:yes gene_type:complete